MVEVFETRLLRQHGQQEPRVEQGLHRGQAVVVPQGRQHLDQAADRPARLPAVADQRQRLPRRR